MTRSVVAISGQPTTPRRLQASSPRRASAWKASLTDHGKVRRTSAARSVPVSVRPGQPLRVDETSPAAVERTIALVGAPGVMSPTVRLMLHHGPSPARSTVTVVMPGTSGMTGIAPRQPCATRTVLWTAAATSGTTACVYFHKCGKLCGNARSAVVGLPLVDIPRIGCARCAQPAV